MQKIFNWYLLTTAILFVLFLWSGGLATATGMFILLWGIFGIVAGIFKRSSKTDFRVTIAIIGLVMFFVGGSILPQPDKASIVDENKTSLVNGSDSIDKTVTPKAYPVTESGLRLYKVTSITDGDTIKVSIDGKTETIRFIGVDTPETKDPNQPVQCYGKEASSRMQHFVQSKSVALEADPTQDNRDKYNRLLRYVYLEDGTNVGLEMIKGGHAHEYTYAKAYKYQAEFLEAQRVAQESKAGFWSPTTCNGDTTQSATAANAANSAPSSPAPSPVSPTPKPATVPTPAPAPAPAPAPQGNCDPNYTPCIPNVSYDLDCGDIRVRVTVIGVDRHGLDNGGIPNVGCESY